MDYNTKTAFIIVILAYLVYILNPATLVMGGVTICDYVAKYMHSKTDNSDCMPEYKQIGPGSFFYYKPHGNCDTIASVQQIRNSLQFAIRSIPERAPINSVTCLRLGKHGRAWGYAVTRSLDSGLHASVAACNNGDETVARKTAFVKNKL